MPSKPGREDVDWIISHLSAGESNLKTMGYSIRPTKDWHSKRKVDFIDGAGGHIFIYRRLRALMLPDKTQSTSASELPFDKT